MRHDLTRLGEAEFEDLSQSLAIAVLGSAVSVFGDGPDGGREATFEGLTRYPDPIPPEGPWNGYGLVQAKYKRTVTSTSGDTTWFLGKVREELKRWADDNSARVKRGRRPQYLIFATNVTLSADPFSGGVDRANRLIREYQEAIGLKGWAVWHSEQICRYLDLYEGVRRTYAALLTAGDVLADLQHVVARLASEIRPPEDFGKLLTTQAAKELGAQQWVRLGQAGDTSQGKLLLSQVGVDLPAQRLQAGKQHGDESVPGTIAHIVAQGDSIRRPRPGRRPLPHLALQGGPGQGKSTIAQLLSQVYRVALLETRPTHTLGHEVPDLLDQYRRHLVRLGIPTPRVRRWPAVVPLSEFADSQASDGSMTLLKYIAEQVRQRSPINSVMLKEWLREWPWLVVLDGLDEVAAPDARERMLGAISDFFLDAGEVEADLLVVATTRPQGYRDEFSPRYYEHLVLRPMDTGNALDYAEHLSRVRYQGDPDLAERVARRLRAAAEEPVTARLMRTPLQVTIMALLLERRSRAPQDRYGLFEAYYNTLYDREINKGTPTSRLLDDQRRHIDYLHEQVGLRLQVRAEHVGEAESQLAEEELEGLAYQRLVDEEYPELAARTLARQVVSAALDRLVLLVGHGPGTVGFEVRSLQEVMAARALFAGNEPELLERLRVLAPSAHWRNTWLFATSRLFAQREVQRDALLTMLDEIDSNGPLELHLLPGSRLALAMLDEDIAAGHPRFVKLLVQKALRLLDGYPGATIGRLATVLNDAAAVDYQVAEVAYPIIESKISSGGRGQTTALDMMAAWADLKGNAAIRAQSRIRRLNSNRPEHLEEIINRLRSFSPRASWWSSGPATVTARPTAADEFAQGLTHQQMPKEVREKLIAVVRSLVPSSASTRRRWAEKQEQISAAGALRTVATLTALVSALDEMDPTRWPAASEIHEALVHWHERQPIPESSIVAL